MHQLVKLLWLWTYLYYVHRCSDVTSLLEQVKIPNHWLFVSHWTQTAVSWMKVHDCTFLSFILLWLTSSFSIQVITMATRGCHLTRNINMGHYKLLLKLTKMDIFLMSAGWSNNLPTTNEPLQNLSVEMNVITWRCTLISVKAVLLILRQSLLVIPNRDLELFQIQDSPNGCFLSSTSLG